MKMNKGIIILCALVTVYLTGCKDSLNITILTRENSSSENIISAITENKALLQECLIGSQRSADLTEEEEQIRAYLENPESLYEDLNSSEDGKKFLLFYEIMSNPESTTEELLACAKEILTEDEYEALFQSVNEMEITSEEVCSRAVTVDKYAHIFAGAAVAMATTSAIYACTPGIFVAKKVAAAAALSVSAGVTAGALKELWDYFDPNGTVDFGDFIATALGSGIGTVFAAGVTSISCALLQSTTGSVIINGVFAVVCGYTALHIVGKI